MTNADTTTPVATPVVAATNAVAPTTDATPAMIPVFPVFPCYWG